MSKIHSTAVISRKAELGPNVQVGPYAVIEDNVVLGEGVRIGPHTQITGYTTIGKDTEIFNGAVIGARPQDLKYKGEKTFLEIGERNMIREFTTINPGTGEGGKTIIGSDNLVMAYAHIAHDCKVGSHCVLVNGATLGGHITVEDHVLVSGLTAVHQFVRVGRLAIIGGCSKVVQDIPPFSTCDGHPARLYGLNRIGLKRNHYSLAKVKALDEAFNVLFNSGMPIKKGIEKLEKEKNLSEDVNHLINFIKSSTRGITRSCRTTRSADEE